jgi:hypothetical protein
MTKLKAGISVLALLAMTAEASAAELCDRGASSALKTAAVQQELMVAGLMCHDTVSYNRFVIGFQTDLQKSDAALMSYFRNRDGNEAGYDSYKTKLANLAAMRSSMDGSRYCAAVRAEFAAAAASAGLTDFIAHDRLLITVPEACAVKYEPVTVAVAGVPTHDLPAMPYGAQEDAPQPAYAAAPLHAAPAPVVRVAARAPEDELPLPPRYDRYGRVIAASDTYSGDYRGSYSDSYYATAGRPARSQAVYQDDRYGGW